MERLFPGGKKRAFTLSYDDGVLQDIRLTELLNRYGVKGTFNLNSGRQSRSDTWMNGAFQVAHLNWDEIVPIYQGHECAIHSKTHPDLARLGKEEIRQEVLEDKAALEQLFGYPVWGMAYPYGTWNDTVVEVLREEKIHYSRTIVETENFAIPEEFLTWHPTCHHNNPHLFELAERFLSTDEELPIFYVWGHSYEFDSENNWERMEQLLQMVSEKDDVWFATNIEIADFCIALAGK